MAEAEMNEEEEIMRDELVLVATGEGPEDEEKEEELDRDDLFFELMRGVNSDDLETVQSLASLMCVTEVAQLDPRPGSAAYGLSPLHRSRSPGVAKVLLDLGVPVDLEGVCGATPLMVAVAQPSVVALLLERGADVDRSSTDGTTALHHAVLNSNLESVRLLVEAGAQVNAQDAEGNAALHMVGELQVARFLVSSGAEVDLANAEGNIPLEEAVAKGRHHTCLETADFLLGRTQRAATSRTQQLVEALKQHVRKVGSVPLNESIPVAGLASADEGSEDLEERVAFAASSEQGSKDKWSTVKARVMKGAVRMLKVRGPAERASEFTGSKAAFAKRSTSMAKDLMAVRAGFYQGFFELMVRERPELALRILDDQRELLYQRHGCATYNYRLDLIGTPLRCTSAVKAMVQHRRYELVAHPVVQWLITCKFLIFTRYLLFYEFALAGLFCALVAVTFSAEPGNQARRAAALFRGRFVTEPGWASLADAGAMVLQVLLHVVNLRYLVTHLVFWKSTLCETDRAKVKLVRYLFSGDTLLGDLYAVPHWLLIWREVLLAANHPSNSALVLARVLSAVIFLMLAQRCIHYAEGIYEDFGLTISTIRQMFYDTRTFFQVLGLYILVFGVTMSMLYSGSGMSDFDSLLDSFVTLFLFVFNLDVSNIMADPLPLRRIFALLLLSLYMVVVVLTLVNLIIAVYSNTYEAIRTQAREQVVLNRATFVLQIEDFSSVFGRIWAGELCCPKANRWHKWEKENVLGRKVAVKEFPDGRTLIETRQPILRFVYKMCCPPYFMACVRLLDAVSDWLAPMPMAGGFSWRKVDLAFRAGGCRSDYGTLPRYDEERSNRAAVPPPTDRDSLIAESMRSRSGVHVPASPTKELYTDLEMIAVGTFVHDRAERTPRPRSRSTDRG